MSNKSAVYSLLSFSLLMAAVCGVFLTFSKASGYDDALSFRVVSWLLVCCLAAFLVFTFAFKEKFLGKTNFKSKSYFFTCALGVFLSGGLSLYGLIVLVCSLVCRLMKSAAVRNPNALIPNPASNPTNEGEVYAANVLFIAALLGTAVYFSFCLFSQKEKRSTLFAALSVFPSVALVVKLIADFLAQNSNGYSKLYNFHLLSLAFFLLFFVNESRIYMKKSAAALYVFFGVAGSMAALVCDLPFAYSADYAGSGAVPMGSLHIFADLLVVLYIYVRLFSLGFRKSEEA